MSGTFFVYGSLLYSGNLSLLMAKLLCFSNNMSSKIDKTL